MGGGAGGQGLTPSLWRSEAFPLCRVSPASGFSPCLGTKLTRRCAPLSHGDYISHPKVITFYIEFILAFSALQFHLHPFQLVMS